jgi:hypothetical protein
MASQLVLESPSEMGRKKSERKTVMIRAFEEFAEKVKQASAERGLSAAEFFEAILTPCVDKAHRDYIDAESRRLKGGDKK